MSEGLGIYISRSFIELSYKKSSHAYNGRMAYSLNSMESQLKTLIALSEAPLHQTEHIEVRTKLPWLVLERRIGSSPAFLTTSGFESWLDMNLPLGPEHWSTELKKTSSALQKESVFGLNERTSASGEIEQALQLSELEFMAEKLKMSEVSHVAIGFLHSQKNPKHEKMATSFFREKGFQVYASHEVSNDPEERPRFWTAILNAYVAPFLKEKMELVQKTLVELGAKETSTFYNGTSLKDALSGTPVWLSPTQQFKTVEPSLYCGLEDFELLADARAALPTDHPRRVMSPLGWMSGAGFSSETLRPSPTQKLENNFWGALDWSLRGENESGPIALGRGVQPTVLDALAAQFDISKINGLEDRLNEKVMKRIQDAFKAYSKSVASDTTPVHQILKSVAVAWVTQISQAGFLEKKKKLKLIGPLAPATFEILKSLKASSYFELGDSQFFLSQLCKAQTKETVK